MLRPDWDCPVCTQPNSAEDAECINCECPFGCSGDALAKHIDVYANQESMKSTSTDSDALAFAVVGKAAKPSARYLHLFAGPPTLFRSVLVFSLFYIGILVFGIPLALKLQPGTLSSVCFAAFGTAAVAVGEYWEHCNILSELRSKKWALIWLCLSVTLVVDLLALICGIDIFDIYNIKSSMLFLSLMLFLMLKIGHIAFLWITFATNWLVSGKASSRPKKVYHTP